MRLDLSLVLLFSLSAAWVPGCYRAHGIDGGPCDTTADCPDSTVSCGEQICVVGTCRFIPIPDSCAADETCDPVRGCVGPRTDTRSDAPDTSFRDAPFERFDTPFEPFDTPFDSPGARPDGPITFPDVPFDSPGARPDGPITFPDVPLDSPGARPDAPITFPDVPRDAPFVRPDVPISFPDTPAFDAPIVRPDVPITFPDVPLDAPLVLPDVGVDAGLVTSMARRCRLDSVITVVDRPVLSTAETTLELWARIRGAGVIARKGIGARRHYQIEVRGSGMATTLLVGWGNGALESSFEVPIGDRLGRYTHIAVVTRADSTGASTLTLFLDAVMVGSTTIPGLSSDAFNNEPLLFCSFDGDLDEIRLWGAALDAGLIESRRFGTVPASSAGLIAYWPLEGFGQIIFDRTLIGSDGVAGDFSTPDPRDPVAFFGGAF